MNKRLYGAATLAAILLISLSPPRAPAQMPMPGMRNQPATQQRGLVESLREAGNFKKLLVILDKAGMTGTLSDSTKGLTLFAPDDAAFDQLPAALVAKLTADTATARAFILPYILTGKLTSKDLPLLPAPRDRLRTFAGTTLRVSDRGGAGLLVIFDGATHGKGDAGWPCCGRVTSADHVTANGVYHVISFAAASGGV